MKMNARKKWLSFLMFVIVSLVFVPFEAEAATQLSQMNANQIITALKSNGFPIKKYSVYTTNSSDPNHLIGKPNQYKSKADFIDKDYYNEYYADNYTGTIEVFSNSSDASRRNRYLKTIFDAVPSFAQRIYQYSNVLVRIDYGVPVKRLNFYKNAFSYMSKGKEPRYPVSINKKSTTILVGKSETLKLNISSKKVKWSSSNKSIATVNSSGKITAKKKGSATISAKYNWYTVKCKVNVKNFSLSINKKTLSLSSGRSETLKLNVSSKNASWKSSNSKIVTVDKNGKVIAKSVGTATITATYNKSSVSCKVTVSKLSVSGIYIETINFDEDYDDVEFRITNRTGKPITVKNTLKAYDDDYAYLCDLELPFSNFVSIASGDTEDVVFLDFTFSHTIYYSQRLVFSIVSGGKTIQCRAEYTGNDAKPYKFTFY